MVAKTLRICVYVAGKIHVSPSTAQILFELGGFQLEKRGIVEFKVGSSQKERAMLAGAFSIK